MNVSTTPNQRNGLHPATNPFATRWIRPGAIPYLFDDASTLAALVHRLRINHWRGAIVGPHGSGKSTLLATLVQTLTDAGRQVIVVRLHGGQRRLPIAPQEFRRLRPCDTTCHGRVGRVLAVDGYEQLNRWQRWRLSWHCRRQDCGLLITSHTKCSLPVVWETVTSLDLVERLITDCLPPHDGRITEVDIRQAWRRHGANVREALFELYNVFEARRPDCKNYNDRKDDSYTGHGGARRNCGPQA